MTVDDIYFSKTTVSGIKEWPLSERETTGFVILRIKGHKAKIIFQPGVIWANVLPELPPGNTYLASFHSHPTHCSTSEPGRCFYQPPSNIDLQTFRQMCETLGMCTHVVVADRSRLFIVRILHSGAPDFSLMLKTFENLNNLEIQNIEDHEFQWLKIALEFPHIISVQVIVA